MGLIVAIEHLEALKAVTLNSTAQPAAGFTFRHGIELLFFYFFIGYVPYFVLLVLYKLARCHTPIS